MATDKSRRGWQFWIDRGGTFTDVVARAPGGRLFKPFGCRRRSFGFLSGRGEFLRNWRIGEGEPISRGEGDTPNVPGDL